MQPGPGHRAGVDATQLLADGGEEGAGPLQVVQQQDHAVVAHCGQHRGSVRGWGRTHGVSAVGMGPPGVMELEY